MWFQHVCFWDTGMAPDLKRELLSKSGSLTQGVGSDTPSLRRDFILMRSVTVYLRVLLDRSYG